MTLHTPLTSRLAAAFFSRGIQKNRRESKRTASQEQAGKSISRSECAMVVCICCTRPASRACIRHTQSLAGSVVDGISCSSCTRFLQDLHQLHSVLSLASGERTSSSDPRDGGADELTTRGGGHDAFPLVHLLRPCPGNCLLIPCSLSTLDDQSRRRSHCVST